MSTKIILIVVILAACGPQKIGNNDTLALERENAALRQQVQKLQGNPAASEAPDKADARNPLPDRETPEASQAYAVTRAVVPHGHGPYAAYVTDDDCLSGEKSVRNNVCKNRDGGLNCRYQRSGRSAYVTSLTFKTSRNEPVVIAGAERLPAGETLLGPQQRICIRIGRVPPVLQVSSYDLKPEGFLALTGKAPTRIDLSAHDSFVIDETSL